MPEKDQEARDETVQYEGLYKFPHIVKLVKDRLSEKGYYVVETGHDEILTPEGKSIKVKFKATKIATDYAKQEVKINIVAKKLQEKLIDKQGRKQTYNTGTITLEINASLITDYSSRWQEDKPGFYLLRLLFEKHIYSPYSKRMKTAMRQDVDDVKNAIKKYIGSVSE